MFSVMDVSLEKNTKGNHLWVVALGSGGGTEADSSAALRNDKQSALRNDKQSTLRNDKQSALRYDKQVRYGTINGKTKPRPLWGRGSVEVADALKGSLYLFRVARTTG